MALEFLEDQLKEFNLYKQMILNDEVDNKNTIVERKDGSCTIIPRPFHPFKSHCFNFTIPIEDINRITIFHEGREYEFVACQ